MSRGFVLTIDQGTTSTRCAIFDGSSTLVSAHRRDHRQIAPRPGWVEHDPLEIWGNLVDLVAKTLAGSGLDGSDLAAIGIASQRGTVVMWHRTTGEPIYNAIAWNDSRSSSALDGREAQAVEDRLRRRTGLPLSSNFSAPKIQWLLENVPRARELAIRGELCVGTVDSWLIYKLTRGSVHATDVTNASRTMLMDLESLQWDPEALKTFGIPSSILPEIRSSTASYGTAVAPLQGVPILAAMGDQQAALLGQVALDAGALVCTYGSETYALLSTGSTPVHSDEGLLTTVAFQLEGEAPRYAIEGALPGFTPLGHWFQEGSSAPVSMPAQLETLAATVPDGGGSFIVPLSPRGGKEYWQPVARGMLVGLANDARPAQLARTILEAIAWQTKDVVDSMLRAYGTAIESMKVAGDLVSNDLLMRAVADAVGVPIERPLGNESTGLGVAYAAGLGAGVWPDLESLRSQWHRAAQWVPTMDAFTRQHRYTQWSRFAELARYRVRSGEPVRRTLNVVGE